VSWPTQPLGMVVDARSGFASGDDVSEGVFQFRMNNVTQEGGIDLTRRRRVPIPKGGLDRLLLQPGDVLFNATNSPELVGKTAYFSGFDEPATFSNHFIRLRPRGDADGRYVARWLTYQYRRAAFDPLIKRWVNQAAIDKAGLLKMPIPLPPLAEQRRIAAILDRVDALRTARRHAITLLDEATKVIFLEMFGDPVSNPKGWSVKPLGKLARIIRGASPRPKGDPRYFGGEIPWLLISDVTREPGRFVTSVIEGVTEAGRDRSVYLPTGTLILTNSATVGLPKLLGVASCIHDGFLAIMDIDSSLERDYLYGFFSLMRPRLAQLAPEGTQKNLNIGIVQGIKVITPSLTLQRAYVSRVESVERVKDCAANFIVAADSLFDSIRHRAFRGEL
jgi:type I restriction enzyme S subunit